MKFPTLVVCALLAGSGVTSAAFAEGNATVNDTWRVYVGAFNADVNCEVSITGDILKCFIFHAIACFM